MKRMLFLFLTLLIVAFPLVPILKENSRYLNWPVNWRFFTSHLVEPYGVFFYQSGEYKFQLIRPSYKAELPLLSFIYSPIFNDRMEKKFWSTVFSEQAGKRDFFCKHYEIPTGQKVFVGPLDWRASSGFLDKAPANSDLIFLDDQNFKIGYFQC